MRKFAVILKQLLPWLHEVLPEGRNFAFAVLQYIADGFKDGDLNTFVEQIRACLQFARLRQNSLILEHRSAVYI